MPALYWECTHGGGGEADYGLALDRLLGHCGLTGGPLRTVPPRLHHESMGHGAGLMSSHNQVVSPGLWRPLVRVWDTVEQGELLGHVLDPFGDPIAEMPAEHAGTVISLLPMQHVRQGISVGILL